jgi:hypothetical protein
MRTLLGRSKIRSAAALGTPALVRVSIVFFCRARYSSKYCLALAVKTSGSENRQSSRAASSSSMRTANTGMIAEPGWWLVEITVCRPEWPPP